MKFLHGVLSTVHAGWSEPPTGYGTRVTTVTSVVVEVASRKVYPKGVPVPELGGAAPEPPTWPVPVPPEQAPEGVTPGGVVAYVVAWVSVQ